MVPRLRARAARLRLSPPLLAPVAQDPEAGLCTPPAVGKRRQGGLQEPQFRGGPRWETPREGQAQGAGTGRGMAGGTGRQWRGVETGTQTGKTEMGGRAAQGGSSLHCRVSPGGHLEASATAAGLSGLGGLVCPLDKPAQTDT